MYPLRTGMILPQLPGSPSYLRPGTRAAEPFIMTLSRGELTVEGQIRTQKGDPRLEPRIPVVLAERLGRERSGVARLDRYRHVGLRHLIATPVTGLSKGQAVEVVP